eukprot:5614567-Amphidinium_carterae.1
MPRLLTSSVSLPSMLALVPALSSPGWRLLWPLATWQETVVLCMALHITPPCLSDAEVYFVPSL